ncbi:pilus assembly protein [Ottowia beijingensis]|uniref:pilus assembly protein n=1 Tax=Ottowia beijingensis TaxID=1207057 RepID=UPI00363AC562
MKKSILPRKRVIAAVVATIGLPLPLLGAPLDLAQYPAGSAYRMPAPNVILSVDNSGSMNNLDGTGKKRIQWLKEGLQNTLINQSTYDNRFRLAWQSFTCDNIPSNSGGCQNKNALNIFSGTHKANFSTWVAGLVEGGWTPSHKMVWNAGEYLKKTGADNPWNTVPGTADDNPLTCRKAYHIFLSDGGWNRYREDIAPAFNAFGFQAKMASDSAERISDADRTNVTFPDGKSYSTTDPQTQVYQGAGGGGTATTTYNVTTNPNDGSPCNAWNRSGQCTRWAVTRHFAYPTLSDMAFHYWSTDLQPSIANEIIPDVIQSGDETFVSTTGSQTLEEYWNPKNNPATWQHMKHYTIGYGKTASQWTNSGTNPLFTGGMYGSGLTDVVTGGKFWTDTTLSLSETYYDRYRPEELWHMAINSRGEFFPVTGGDLTPVFERIFGAIIADTSQPVTSFTSASGSISRVGTSAYQASYVAADDQNSLANRWYGYVASNSISTSGTVSPNTAWGTTGAGQGLTTADKLDAIPTSSIPDRLVLSFNDETRTGISFEWLTASSPLSDAQKTLLKGTDTDAVGRDRVNFIRGDRSKEQDQTGGTFRTRKSRQGDIVNSAVWYIGQPASAYSFGGYTAFTAAQRKRTPMLYVGGNDGMLHGFSATDGTEKIAYVPQGVIKNLPALTRPNYDHQYYVDGSPFTGDLKLGSGNTAADWATYLVGTLGAGGKGFFVLDVTNPGASDGSTPSDFVKTKAGSLVVMDKTAFNADPSDPDWPEKWKDIGHIFGGPVVAENNTQRALQITRTNDNRWAVVLGNGYNSVNERPVLLIQYLDGDKSLKIIPAVPTDHAEAKSNGLSTPQFLDVNGDGIPDFVYAGDLRGNMWKFDIASNDPAQWKVAFGGKELFRATYTSPSGGISRQPITTPPVFRPNREVGGLMVAFGTGRNLTEGDRTDVSRQSLYSVLDNTRYEVETAAGASRGKVKVKDSNPTPATVTRAQLQSQSVDEGSQRAGGGISSGRTFWKLEATRVKYDCPEDATDCTEKKGWYMDLPEVGERSLASIDFYDGGNLLEIITEVPASGSATADSEEVCTPSPRSVKNFRTLLNITTGLPAGAPLMNVDGNTTTDANGVTTGVYNSIDAGYARMTASPKELRVGSKFEQRRAGSDGVADNLAKLPELLLRPNWRQLR